MLQSCLQWRPAAIAPTLWYSPSRNVGAQANPRHDGQSRHLAKPPANRGHGSKYTTDREILPEGGSRTYAAAANRIAEEMLATGLGPLRKLTLAQRLHRIPCHSDSSSPRSPAVGDDASPNFIEIRLSGA